MFGQQNTPFGQQNTTPAFGSPTPAPGGFFGAPAPAPDGLFGSTAASTSIPFGGGGSGAAPAPFGAPAPAPSLFGQLAPAPAFGSFSAAAPSGSMFGQPQPTPAPAFGCGIFGAPAPSTFPFGGGGSTFGAPAPSAFGGSTFGAAPDPYGAPAGGGGLFGQHAAPAPALGESTGGGLFGQPAPAPGGFGTFGAPAPPTTGGLFGAPAPAPGGFGAPTGTFGAPAAQPGQQGTRGTPFQVTTKRDNNTTINLHSITAMPQYKEKSFEELRYEDYSQGSKGTASAAPAPGTGGFSFGATPAPAPSGGLFGFGAPAPAFGAPAPAPFGAPALFGAPAPTPFGTGAMKSTQSNESTMESDFALAVSLQIQDYEDDVKRSYKSTEQVEDLTTDEKTESTGTVTKLPSRRGAMKSRQSNESTMESDFALAVSLQIQDYEDDVMLLQGDNDTADPMAAARLERCKAARKEAEEQKMVATVTGRAWKIVEKVIQLQKVMQASNVLAENYASEVAVDDMVFCAERLLLEQESFVLAGKPDSVDIGYHYTLKANFDRIKTDGLLTKAERDSNGIQVNFNGSAYGDGIYTADSPITHTGYGDVGILVARLKGIDSATHLSTTDGSTQDTCSPPGTGIVVLRRSSQCLPLVRFKTSLINLGNQGSPGNNLVKEYHCKLQEIVNEFLNGSNLAVAVAIPPHAAASWNGGSNPAFAHLSVVMPPLASAFSPAGFASTSVSTNAATSAGKPRVIPARAPKSVAVSMPPATAIPTTPISVPSWIWFHTSSPLPLVGQSQTLQYTAPESLDSKVPDSAFHDIRQTQTCKDDCMICFDPLFCAKKPQRVVSLTICQCQRSFHFTCISKAVQGSGKCPCCRKQVGTPVGKMPSGTMTVTVSNHTCGGHAPGTIVIQYNIPGGVQKEFHDQPGCPHYAAARIAYVPKNADGTALLKRLKFAFLHGLSFTVGRSLATDQPNSVTWSSIHHKTSISAGPHGYPDPAYFTNVNGELDALGVPAASML